MLAQDAPVMYRFSILVLLRTAFAVHDAFRKVRNRTPDRQGAVPMDLSAMGHFPMRYNTDRQSGSTGNPQLFCTKRAVLKSSDALGENRMQNSVRGRPGHWPVYLDSVKKGLDIDPNNNLI